MKLKYVLMLSAAVAVIGFPAAKTYANGLIVPAYLPLTDTTDWNILAQDASIGSAASNPVNRDYWVVANSNNGPYTLSTDWTTANGYFSAIQANGGLVFGYVHCNQNNPNNDALLRPLTSVESDISAWVAGDPNLNGIWLDEFYPRYEIAPDGGSTVTFPNGAALAPYDTTYYNTSTGLFNGNQVIPDGGYYSQLVSWIRCTYPRLRIIGNAGGWFFSNQTRYADLPNVTCSFEQSYAVAANSPTNDWSGLNRQNTTTWRGQLAIIHGNSSDLNGAIDQAISHGYTHYYTTNAVYGTNIYGTIPPYFTSEVQYIAAHS